MPDVVLSYLYNQMFSITQFHEAIANTWSKYTAIDVNQWTDLTVPNNPPSTYCTVLLSESM